MTEGGDPISDEEPDEPQRPDGSRLEWGFRTGETLTPDSPSKVTDADWLACTTSSLTRNGDCARSCRLAAVARLTTHRELPPRMADEREG